ncbi:M20/M25/M40 family metallo-hydrolase [Candidatus Peregrinibacteria bacterium]|nr:M20/M25/M40 family metallo-hydrolase [Candidatus Peregrinibacteria bacterium]
MEQKRAHYGEEGFEQALEGLDADTQEVAKLAAELCAVRSISVPPQKANLEAIGESFDIVKKYAEDHGLRIQTMEPNSENPYPFMLITFSHYNLERPPCKEAIALMGHLDVVPAGEEQFQPETDGKNLYARGAADMKTVVATYLAWMAKMQEKIKNDSTKILPFIFMLSGCEENGSCEGHNTETALEMLEQKGIRVRFAVVGERTGELEWMKNLKVGPICTENRSWRWARTVSKTSIEIADKATMPYEKNDRKSIDGEAIDGKAIDGETIDEKPMDGMEALKTIAEIVKLGRERIQALNETIDPEKSAKQPGLRSGFVNPFVSIGPNNEYATFSKTTKIHAVRKGGKAIHAASAQTSKASLIETFLEIAENASQTFGTDTISITCVTIGEEGNFNTYDGSGAMRIVINADDDAVQQWMTSNKIQQWMTMNNVGITLSTLDEIKISDKNTMLNDGTTPNEPTTSDEITISDEVTISDKATMQKEGAPSNNHGAIPSTDIQNSSVFGIDLRELPEHKTEVENLIAQIREQLATHWNFQMVNNRPSWKCPSDHEDLQKLRLAYATITDESSPHYVKLHGNDGGSLAERQQLSNPRYAQKGLGDAVVFGQVGKFPHGKGEFHDLSSVSPYIQILDEWAKQYEVRDFIPPQHFSPTQLKKIADDVENIGALDGIKIFMFGIAVSFRKAVEELRKGSILGERIATVLTRNKKHIPSS